MKYPRTGLSLCALASVPVLLPRLLDLLGFEIVLRYSIPLYLAGTALFLWTAAPLLRAPELPPLRGLGLLPVLTGLAVLSTALLGDCVINTLLMLSWFGCAVTLALRSAETTLFMVLQSAVTILFSLAIFFLVFFQATFGQIGCTEIVRTLPSPDGTYCAHLINSDQGALGGDTLVEVHDTRYSLDLFFFQVRRESRLVYLGEWGEFQTMDLSWKDDQTLMIDGTIYPVA